METNVDLLDAVETEEPTFTWAAALAELKERAEFRGSLSEKIVQEDSALLQIVLIWPLVPITTPVESKPPRRAKRHTYESWLHKYAWQGVVIDHKKMKQLMGRPRQEVENALDRAKALSVIWPDGTPNETLMACIAAKLGRDIVRAQN